MHPTTVAIFAIVCCCIAQGVIGYEDRLSSEENGSSFIDRSAVIQTEDEGIGNGNGNGAAAAVAGATLKREKRTLLLKKKLIGAGLLGFGLGVAKGYKAGYYSAPPQVHRVYLSPPPAAVKYVEYIEKPVFVERIIERPSPVFKPRYAEYKESAPYGSW